MSKYISIRSGATALTEQQVAHFDLDTIYNTGILDFLSNHWLVSQHNPLGMTLDIAVGRGFFVKTTMVYEGYTDAVENVTITANNSGNPRVDAVVIYVDLGASADATASNVLKTLVVAGTPAGSPVAPIDSAIQTAVGAGNPFVRLANVAVANGASQITDANITDMRTAILFKFLMGVLLGKRTTPTVVPANEIALIAKLRSTRVVPFIVDENLTEREVQTNDGWVTVTDGASPTFDRGLGKLQKLTLGNNRTLVVSNMNVGDALIVKLIQDGTGSRTVTWWAGISWQDGTIPTLTAVINKADTFVIICTGANTYDGFIAGQGI